MDLILLTVPLALSLVFKFGWKCACPMGLVRGLLANSNKTLVPVVDQVKILSKFLIKPLNANLIRWIWKLT